MLDKKQSEALLIMQEECAEVIQAISKIYRFGSSNFKPGKNKTNLEHLEDEIGDLLCLLEIIHDLGLVRSEKIELAMLAKRDKLKIYSGLYHESKTN